MRLSNRQYDQIMHIYEDRQLARQRELEHRKRVLFAREPRIREVEDAIRRTAIHAVEKRLHGGVAASKGIGASDELARLMAEKAALIKRAGFEPDYLDVPYECPDCRDTGYVDGRRCHCFLQLSMELMLDSHTELLTERSLRDFLPEFYPDSYVERSGELTPRAAAERSLAKARRFIGEFDHTFDNILLFGKTGTGKTHLSTCIGGELLSLGHTVVYLTAFELFSIMKQETFSKEPSPKGEFARMFSCDLLIIDDLGTEFANSLTNSQAFELINERIRSRSSTLISTNLGLDQLRQTYTERIVSRFVEYYTTLTLMGQDIRMLKKGLIREGKPPFAAGYAASQ